MTITSVRKALDVIPVNLSLMSKNETKKEDDTVGTSTSPLEILLVSNHDFPISRSLTIEIRNRDFSGKDLEWSLRTDTGYSWVSFNHLSGTCLGDGLAVDNLEVTVNTRGLLPKIHEARFSIFSETHQETVHLSIKLTVLERSSYFDQLPYIYSKSDMEVPDDGFSLNQFLWIFEQTLGPIENMIHSLNYYFDPQMAPDGMVNWLANALGLGSEMWWPLKKKRDLLSSASELYRLRGTAKGLEKYLKIYLGENVKVAVKEKEGQKGFFLGDDLPETQVIDEYPLDSFSYESLAWLEHNTYLSEGAHVVTVRIEHSPSKKISIEHVKRIIQTEKPAHVFCIVEIEEVKATDDEKNE